MRALVVGTFVAVVAFGAVSCGGSTTHNVFVDEAARICREANARFAELEIVDPTARRAAAVLERVSEIGSEALEDLRDLKPPERDQVDVASWLGTLEQALDEVGYIHELLGEDRFGEALDAAVRADLLTGRARTLARRVGLERVCSVPKLLPEDITG